MEFFKLFGANLIFCIIGLLGYSFWSVRKHIAKRTFKWSIFWEHNEMFWYWAGGVQVLYAGLMAYLPTLENWLSIKLVKVLEAALGMSLEIPENLITTIIYLTLTWQLSRVVNKSVSKKDKIGPKKSD